MKLSVVIPSYKDPYLFKTIADLLKNSELGDKLEIIAVFDGYYPDGNLIIQDPRVRYVHLGSNRGMRGAINAGVAISRGEYIMRLDEHCAFGRGYDRILTDQCGENNIITARRFFLDPVRWEVMTDKGYIDCEKLVIQDMGGGVRKFSGQKWQSRAEEMKNESIIEAQAMQGSMWVMKRSWWDKHIKELQTEGYGPTYQDSVEVCMKTWKNGGRLIFTKDTWYAHKHRSFPRTHQEGSRENPSNRESSWKYALDTWGEYYEKELLPKWRNL